MFIVNEHTLSNVLQAKFDFVNDVAPMEDVRGEAELTRYKNESLGMAVLHMSHKALQSDSNLQDVAKHIRWMFFQNHTLDSLQRGRLHVKKK